MNRSRLNDDAVCRRWMSADHFRLSLTLLFAAWMLMTIGSPADASADDERPNIVFILADDLGYGDVKCFGGESCQIETPGFDRIAREGMRFTNAQANASVCVPTRVAIMTGRYPWRFGKPGPGGPWGFLGTRLPTQSHTLGRVLSSAGYRTGYIGKWHLGTRMQTTDGLPQGPRNVDYSKPLTIGPPQYGFDESFILPGSLDMYPYAFVRNNRWVGQVTAQKGWSAFNRLGPAAEDFEDTRVLSTFRDEARHFIERVSGPAKQGSPFFLYLALTAPHTPTSPSDAFLGKSKIGIYGDFVMDADHCVTAVLDALDEHGLAENTLVIATSDHGPAPYAGRRREATYGQIKELEKEGHFSAGPYRGYKFSVFEGGSRVPFVARWPGVVPPGKSCSSLIALQDLMATVAEISGANLQPDQAPDSFSMAPLLSDPDAPPTRPGMVQEATRAMSVRSGGWKLALCPGSGSEGRLGNTPKQADAWNRALDEYGATPKSPDELLHPAFVQLFYLPDDPGETRNLAAERMDKVRELFNRLQESVSRGRTTPGQALRNDRASIKPFASVPAWVWKPGSSRQAGWRCVEADDSVAITFDGKPVLSYFKSVQESPDGIDPLYRRSGYLHPVVTPSGRTVTGDFPPDHPHQHAIFDAWVKTKLGGRKIDFWNQRAGQGGVAHEKVVTVGPAGGRAEFTVELSHFAYDGGSNGDAATGDQEKIPVLRETWTVSARKAIDNAYVFDIESTKVCVADVPLTVQKYHYGGMALRGSNQWFSDEVAAAMKSFQERLEEDPSAEWPDLETTGHRFTTSENKRRFDGNHSRPRWVDVSGRVDGEMAGITVLSHPSNFRFPQPVRLHPSKPYFCFAPMVDAAFELEPGKPFTSRYRYVVHDGPLDPDLIETIWKEYR